ncbi:MAG: alpha/beta hydrolase [Elusimicrobia bacterium]|nr:alpha/beta hydrolase [Elusimicrobiota bacterium]
MSDGSGVTCLKIPGVPELNLAVWETGTATAGVENSGALLLHGMGGNTHWWGAAAPILRTAFRVAALDFRGHGESQWAPPYGIAAYASDVEAARRFLGWEKFILIGHSLGARAALAYAERFPRHLRALIAVDFLPEVKAESGRNRKFKRSQSRPQPHYAGKEEMLRRFHLEPRGTALSREELDLLAAHCVKLNNNGRWTWKFDWRAFSFHYAPVWPSLPKIQTPALVVRGEKSVILAESDLARVTRLMPHAAAAAIPSAHHHVPLDAPRELAARILEFIRSQPAPASRAPAV